MVTEDAAQELDQDAAEPASESPNASAAEAAPVREPDPQPPSTAASDSPPEARAAPAPEPVSPSFSPASASAPPRQPIDFLKEIEVQAAVELGRTNLPIGDVLALGPGSVVHLDKMLGDAAELIVSSTVIALGEVVVVDDRFGLRITKIVSSGSE
jgi:flagellar motor switch protein FliN/FliY